MLESQMLTRLVSWYSEQCNGLWEHSYGILIDTLDNPGWSVKIDLDETPFQDAVFDPVEVNKSQDDWFFCKKKAQLSLDRETLRSLPPFSKSF